MTAQALHYRLEHIHLRRVETIAAGVSNCSSDNVETRRRRLVVGGPSVTVSATKRMIVYSPWEITVDVTFNPDAQGGGTATTGLKVTGLMVLPGPCRVVLTNTEASPEADGGKDVEVSAAS